MTIILLDVDGVLLPWGQLHECAPWGDWQHHSHPNISAWSPSLVAEVWSWTEHASLEWLTTWCSKANADLVPLFGWEVLPVNGEEHKRRARYYDDSWWKADAIVDRILKSDERFVWIDDDLANNMAYSSIRLEGEDRPLRDVVIPLSRSGRLLTVCPRTESALTPMEVKAVRSFISSS